MNRARNLAVLPIPVLIILIVYFGFVHPSARVLEPLYLFPILNTVFLFLVSCVVSYVAMRSYLSSGSSPILLLGAGVLIFGTGAFASGWTIFRWGVNVSATVHNAPLLLAAAFHVAGVIASATEHPPETDPLRRRWKLSVAYITAPVFVCLVFLLSVEGIMPQFFVAGVGTTAIRQVVLASAFVLLIYSSSYMLTRFLWKRDPYLYWYSLALALLAIMSAVFYMQPAVGSPIGWVGRGSQYLAGIYFIVAVVSAKREARARGASLDETVAELFLTPGFHWQDILRTAINGFAIVDTQGRFLEVNEAYCSMLGYTRKELLSISVADVEAVESPSDVLRHIEALKEIRTDRFATKQRRQNGAIIEVEVNATYFGIRKGQIAFFVQDITERKRAENELRLSEEKFAKAFAMNPAAVVMTRVEDGTFLEVNDAFVRMFGFSREEAIGRSTLKLPVWPAPEDRARLVRELKEKGFYRDREQLMVRKSGERFMTLTWAALTTFAGEKIILSTWLDISDRKRAEQALQMTAKRFYDVLSGMYAAILLVTADGRIEYANQAFCDLYRLKQSPESLKEMTAEEMIETIRNAYLKPAEAVARIEEIVRLGRPVEGEEVVLTEGRTCLRDFIPINVDGTVYGRLWHHLDITEHKRAEAALQKAKDELEERVKERTYELYAESLYARSLIEASLDPLVTISIDGKITDVNRASIEATGVPAEQLIGSDFSDYFTQPEKAGAGYKEVFQRGFVRDYPLELKHRDGHVTPVLYNASVYRDETGKIAGVFAAARDMSERRKAEIELARHRDHLEDLVRERTTRLEAEVEERKKTERELLVSEEALREANEHLEQRVRERTMDLLNLTEQLEKSRSDLRSLASELVLSEERERKRIATVLHDEICQTLAVAKMRVDMLQRTLVDGESRQIIGEAREYLVQSIQEARSLMNEVGNPLLFDLGVGAACTSLADRLMASHPIRIQCDVQDTFRDLDPDVKVILYQLIRELLNNVVKHSRARNARVSIRADNGLIHAEVRDDGVGFDPGTLGAPTAEGGFGLFSIQERLKAFHASLQIESAPGKGAVVKASLPSGIEIEPDHGRGSRPSS